MKHKLNLPRIFHYTFCSADEVADVGERLKRYKTSKEKKRKHKAEKIKGEDIDSPEDYDNRQVPMAELDEQEFSSRGSKRKLVDNKTEAVKKKRLLDESSSYRERSSRSSSSKVLTGVLENDRSREGSLWKPSAASEGHKQMEISSLNRYRDDRHSSQRKTKSNIVEEEYSRRGRDRERDRPTDSIAEYSSRKRKRSFLLSA